MCTPRFIYSFAVSVAALFASMVVVPDALAQWTYRIATEPYVRNISVFINTPSAGTNTLFVGTLTDGVYRVNDTNNQSTSWLKINNGLPTVQIRTLSTVDINTLYAGTDGAGLFKTANANSSATWSSLNGSGLTALGCSNIRSINTDATMPLRTLIVGTACRNNSGFYKSTDDGLTWSRLGNGSLPDDVAVSGLLRDVPSNTYFLASSNYGIFKSTDAGVTWTAANTNITAPNGTLNVFNIQFTNAAAVAGTTPTNLLAYVHGSGMYQSTNTGASWTLNNANLPAGFAAMAGIQKESNAAIYVGLDKQGVYKTTNGGNSWAPWANTAVGRNERTLNTRTVTLVPTVPNPTYYFGTIDGVGKVTDTQANFTANTNFVNGVNGPDGGGRLNAITHDRDLPNKVYVTGPSLYQLDYVYGNCNAGCRPLDEGVTGNTIEGVAYQDQTTPANLYVTTSNKGIFKSTNAGALFSAINTGLPNMIGQSSRLAIDASNPLVLYLGLSDAAGVYKSIDGGANWVASNTGLTTPDSRSINTVTIDSNLSTTVYAATDAGLYKSTDSGATWALKYSATDGGGSQLPVNAVRVRIGNSQEVYIANYHANANGTLTASSGVHKSTNGGDSWTNILPNQGASQVRVLVNGDIYAGISATTGNPAVWLSTNGGTSFTPYSGGLNGSDIRAFGVAADSTAVISLSLENGLYTHNTAGPPPSVALSAAITEAPGIFSKVFFGYQTVNTTTASKAVTITNTSATPASIVALGFYNQDNFAIQSHNCPLAPLTLAVGASCTVNITFTPIFNGYQSDTLVAAGPVTGVAVDLSGVGINNGQPGLLVSNDPGMVPAYPGFYTQQTTREITFGTQAIGSSRTISVTLRNVGTATANIGFSGVSAPMSLGGTCGATLAAGSSCVLSVTYAPAGAGIANQTLNITHNSSFPIQQPYPFLLYGVAENPANDGSLVASFGATTNPGGAGKAFVSFGPYGAESISRLVLQSDGKIIVLMTARKSVEDGIAVAGVARLNGDGTVDTTWGTSGYVRLAPSAANSFFIRGNGLYVLGDGKVVVAFASTGATANNDTIIYRLLSNGQIDTGFGTSGSVTVPNLGANRLEIYADGRMLATGNADPVNNNKVGLVRLNADGTPDAGFGIAGRVEQLVPDTIQLGQGTIRTRFAADEKIYLAYPYGAGSARDTAVYKLTTSGAIDTTWGIAGRVNVAATDREDNLNNMRVQADGKILLLSRTARATGGGASESVLARLNADGSIDNTFGTAGVVTTTILTGSSANTNFAGTMRLLADGKIIVAGSRTCGSVCLSGSDGVIARYNQDGSLDSSFGTGGIEEIVITVNSESIDDFGIDLDGSIVAGGQVRQFDVDRGSVIESVFVVRVKNTVGPALVNLSVTVAGSGSVTSAPGGINCGNVCVASFAPTTMVSLTAATSGGSVFAGWSGGGCAGTGACVVTLTMATNVTATFTGGVALLVAVQSRKVHAGVTYDLPITIGVPINGAITVEPRLIGAGHKIVFQFDQVIAAMLPGNVTTTAGTATVTASGNQEVIVTLTGVADNQRATISLSNVNGNPTNGTVSMGFLVGDVSSSQRVNASDISAVKARATGVVTPQNFKYDLNVSGAINGQDTSLVKARSGLSIP